MTTIAFWVEELNEHGKFMCVEVHGYFFVVDTGASVNMLHDSLKEFFPEPEVVEYATSIASIFHPDQPQTDPAPIYPKVNIEGIEIGPSIFLPSLQPFLDEIKLDGFLGLPFLLENKAVIDFEKEIITLHDEH